MMPIVLHLHLRASQEPRSYNHSSQNGKNETKRLYLGERIYEGLCFLEEELLEMFLEPGHAAVGRYNQVTALGVTERGTIKIE